MNRWNAFFTLESLLSLQGATAATLLVPNVLGYLIGDSFQPYQKWMAFVVALGLSYLVAALASDTKWTKWVLAFFNGFLIFASAVGLNQVAGAGIQAGLLRGPAINQLFPNWF